MTDDTRDPHLREALRHAPDAQLQAPAALSELILNEARAKARDPHVSPTEAPAAGWALRLWDWLARPAVATGFAGVMAATLVGVMWWDRPMDEAMPRSPVPVATAPLSARAPAAAPVPAAPVMEAASTLAPAAVSPAARATQPARKAAPSVAAVAPPAPARSEAAAAPTVAAEHEARDRSMADSAAPKSAEAARPAPAAAPAAPAPAMAPPPVPADARSAGAVAKAKEEKKRDEPQLDRNFAPAEVQGRRASAQLQLNESRRQFEGEAYTRVASVRAAIASEPARWTWQRGTTTPQPMNDAITAWLAQLDSSTGTRWQPRRASEAAATPLGRELVLLRDGQVQHRWQLTDRGVWWDRGATTWQLELGAEPMAALRSALDAAAP